MFRPVEPEPIRLGGSPAYAEQPLAPEDPSAWAARSRRPVPALLGDLTDPTTERMRQETGHDCIACPTAVRNLMATAHNALGALEAARTGTGDWARAWRKVAEVREHAMAVVSGYFDPLLDASGS